MTVRIVTDSTADIPREVRERLRIEMVPLKVLFGQASYLDVVDLDADSFYAKLAEAPSLPTTSQPSPTEFSEVYERILREDPGASIISIHLASVLSGTYQSAVLAASMLEEEADITVYDSKSASYGIGTVVVAAAEMAAAGRSKEEILAEIEEIHNRLRLYFLVDTLEYLQKGGRIGKASAVLGSLLNIKPILSLDRDGGVMAVDKVRGQKKAIQRIVDLLRQDYEGKAVDVTMAWTTSRDTADQLLEQLRPHFDIRKVHYTTIGAVIGTHVGPGTSAVFMNGARET